MINKVHQIISVLILGLSLICLTSPSAVAAPVEDTFDVVATVITNLTLSKTADLDFGTFSVNTGGTVTIAPTLLGTRVAGLDVMLVGTSIGASAKFNVTGADLAYTISMPPNPTITDVTDNDTMAVSLTAGTESDGPGLTGTIAGGADTVYIGGTVTALSGITDGLYRIGGSAPVPITVSIAYD